MKIAHISDLHLSVETGTVSDIENKIAAIKAAKVDHLVITGDLTRSGHESQFRKFAELLDRYDFNSHDRLTAIPGNHDLFRFFFRNFQLPSDFYGKIYKVPMAFLQVLKYNQKDYEKDLRLFNSNFDNNAENIIKLHGESICGYPFIKLLSDEIALIAFESNGLIPNINRNAVCSNGYIDPSSAEKILSHTVLKNKIKIVVLHHHLLPENVITKRNGRWFSETMKLVNRMEISDLFKMYEVDLILHGHYHFQEEYYLEDSGIRVINNGDNNYWSLLEAGNNQLHVERCSMYDATLF